MTAPSGSAASRFAFRVSLALLCACLPGLGAEEDPAAPVYLIKTIAGSDHVGDGGTALSGQFDDARGVAVDAAGNVYVADANNHRIRKISASGEISTAAGTGQAGFAGDGGPAPAAQLNRPYGVAVDGAGNLYIADTYNHRVRRVARDGRIETVAGTGEKGSIYTGEPLTTQLMAPRNLAIDSTGNLYIAEFEGHRVKELTTDGQFLNVAGTGVAGFNGESGAAIAVQLDHPSGIALDRAGTLYISDTGNRRLRRVIQGGMTTLLETQWSDGITAVAVDQTGAVVLSDRPYLVRRCDPGGECLVIAGTGNGEYNGEGLPAMAANLAPTDLTIDPSGRLYVAERRRIRMISGSAVVTIGGDGLFGYGGDGGSALAANLNRPSGLALDGSGNVYVSDTGNHRIRKIDSKGNIVSVAGTGLAGDGGLNGSGVWASLASPEGIAFDRNGNLLIADRDNCRVVQLSPSGVLQLVASRGCTPELGGDGDPAGTTALFFPRAVVADTTGAIYVSDTEHHRVLRATRDGVVATYAGNGSAGYAGDGGPANTAQIDSPGGIALDAAHNLYIADTNNNRIRRVSPSGIIETVAGTGWQGFGGDGGPATDASLNEPSGIVLDQDGGLFVADTGNERIRRVRKDGAIETIAGNGLQGYDGDGGLATAARLFRPGYLVLDKTGNLYFTDEANNRVRMLSPHVLLSDPLSSLSVVNAASMQPGPVAPGEIVSLFGASIGPKTGVGASFDADGSLETSRGDSRVLFDGEPAPLFWVQDSQINAQVPYTVAGKKQAEVEIIFKGYSRGKTTVEVAEAAPGLFAVANDPGRGVIIHQDGSLNSPLNPAERYSIVTLYATGEGRTDPGGVAGKPAAAPYPKPVLDVGITIGGFPAELLYAGAAPGFAGLMQVNARVPGGFLPSGLQLVVLTVGNATSQPGVTISIQ